MRKLVLGALFVGAASLATGCIFVSDDDDPIVDDFGSLELAWELDPVGCPVGGDTAELVAVDVDTGDMFTDLVNCTDGINTIDDLLPGLYDVSVNIVSDDRATVFAVSAVEEDVPVNAGELTEVPTFTILTEEAFATFTWTLTEGGAPLACDEIPLGVACTMGGGECDGLSATAFCDDPDGGGGECRDAGDLAIDATIIDSTEAFTQEFACIAGADTNTETTDPVPLGDYTVVIDVVDPAGGGSLFPGTPPNVDETFDIGNEIVDLGEFVLDF